MHRLNDEAAPTPVTDGTNVYAFFGGYGLVAYGADGTELWTRPLGPFTNFHGMGASPILVDGKLVQVCDQDLDAFVIAVDPADGEILWKQARPDFVHSFSTPVVHDRGQGSPEIIVPGSYRMTGYAAEGRELWRLDGLTYQVKSVPVVDGGPPLLQRMGSRGRGRRFASSVAAVRGDARPVRHQRRFGTDQAGDPGRLAAPRLGRCTTGTRTGP